MNRKQFIFSVLTVCLALMIAGCSTTSGTPVLAENDYYRNVGSKQAEQDIAKALSAAKKDIEAVQEKRRNDIQNTSGQVATSAAAGTIMRIVTGKMALGLITGGGTRAGSQAKQDDQDKETFRQDVERRLEQKGYQVEYWKDL